MKIPEEWNILPLGENSKFPPLLKGWETKKYPREKLKDHDGNLALGTGDISGGLVIFDWDFRKGFNRKTEGFKTIYKEYKEKLGKLAATLIAETPHGYHFYYKLKGKKYTNTSQKNGGFSSSLKKFFSKNKVRFGEYLAGLDTRANGGYVVMPPSKVPDGKYKWLIPREPISITHEDYERIMEFFKETDEIGHTMRSKFVDLIMGKLNPHDLATEDTPEHVYWKEMYHEAWRCLGLRAEDLFKGLAKYQKGFDQAETEQQLQNEKNKEYIYSISRLSKDKYEKYFMVKKKTDIKELFEEDELLEDTIHLEGRGDIVAKENGLYLVKYYKKSTDTLQILEGCLKLDKMAYETMNNNRLLLTGIHDGRGFRTLPMDVVLHRLSDYTYQGNTGKDVVKKYIHTLKKDLEVYELSYVLGFNSHWCLPYLEEKDKFQIMTSTDKQIEAYEKSKELPIKYSEKEIEEIKKNMKLFIERTKIRETKLAIIIGWALAAPFRHVFIDTIDLFSILCCYGPRETGKSAILKFFCVDFFGIHEPYNSSVLYSASRFEDLISTGSFPIFIEEIITIPYEILSLIKEHATMSSRFFRKKSARENDFDCLKSAPIVFDCNLVVKSLMDPATNSKLTLVPFTEDEKIGLDLVWVALRKELCKYNLFSLLYEHTKSWTKEDVEGKIKNYLEDGSVSEDIEKNNPRLLQQYAIIQFGLDLFKEVFEVEINHEGFLDVLRYGRTMMTKSLLDDFYHFCMEARFYDPNNTEVRAPKYLNHSLEYYKSKHKGEGYFFMATNKSDFETFCKDKFTLEELCEKLKDALHDNHKNLVSNHNTGKKRGIFINEEFFNLEIFEKKEVLTEKDIVMEHGEVPE